MATKKYYGVRKGRVTGVFSDWDSCKQSIDGYKGAQYKGFPTLEEANAYITGGDDTMDAVSPEDTLLVYVDGSYNEALGKYAFGCVFLLPDGRIFTEYGNGDNPESLVHRNVTGEMLGAMYAVKTAIVNGFRKVEICYDYEGIAKWANGEWKCNNDHTRKYKEAMQNWKQQIILQFTKVAAHTNVKFNELADQMAKKGLTDGNGIPKICKIEELKPWSESD